MTIYELLKEFAFRGSLTMWQSHIMTIIVTSTLTTVAAFFVHKWANGINEQLKIAAIAFESQDGMFVTDAKSIILRVNQAFTRVTGYTVDEALGKTPRLLKSGRHDKAFYVAMWKSINESGSWAGEIWNRRKNGEVYPEQLTITSVKDTSGIVTNYVATLTDVSERKLAEIALEESEFRWKFAIEGSGDGVWDWIVQSDKKIFSHRWKEILGYGEMDDPTSFPRMGESFPSG